MATYGPCSIKQRMVLLENDVDILLTGGGAGGGKSQMALLKALSYIKDPAARVLIMRATYPLLTSIGGLIDSAKPLYREFGAEWFQQSKEFRWKNGAMVKFVAIPDNLAEVQGWQPTHVLFDEGTEASLAAILAVQARIRSVKYKGPKMSMMITCNPDRNSWLYDWVEWCLDEYGVPKKGTENITRYFVNINNKIHWGSSVEELYAEHGKGLKLGKNFIPISFKFIPMTIDDNPALEKAMPTYRANLLAGTRVDQLRFLHGSWTAIPEGSSVFNREWIKIVDAPPVNPVQKVRAWDLAHSIPSETYPNPDYTASTLMSRTQYGGYCIEHAMRFRKLTDGVVKSIVETSQSLDGTDVLVTIPRDNGGGKAASMFFLKTFAEEGMYVRGLPPRNTPDAKMKSFLPFCTLAESGVVTMVRGDWNEEFLTELENFTGERKNKDDWVDSTSDAFMTIARTATMAIVAPPDMTGASPVVNIETLSGGGGVFLN